MTSAFIQQLLPPPIKNLIGARSLMSAYWNDSRPLHIQGCSLIWEQLILNVESEPCKKLLNVMEYDQKSVFNAQKGL